MSTIAIFGGSFNPPHVGHEALCLILLEACGVDQVWLVPTFRHYFGKELVAFEHRFAMCERMSAAFGGRVVVSAIEQELNAPESRMLDTLQELQKRHPNDKFRLAIGADILQETDRWYRWDEVAALAPPLVFGRKGYEGGVLPSPPDVSSTQIREIIAAGNSALPMVTQSVQSYINEAKLYR